jgi:hypothetical protein
MKRLITGAVAAATAVTLFLTWEAAAAWQQRFFGFCNGCGNGSHYLFFSGWGGIFLPPLITLAGIAALWGWHSQCHVSGCYWPTRRVTAANEKACWRHYPHPRRTAADIRRDHHLYLGKQPGKG